MRRIALGFGLLVWAAVCRADFDVYFLRHGETSWNRAKVLQGSVSCTDLTPRGVRMAERTGEGMRAAGLKFDRVYASPYVRARHTAEIVAERLGNRVVVEPQIREMCFGRYEGVRYPKGSYPDENLRLFFEDPDRYVPQGDGAESFAQVGGRIREFLENVLVPLDGKVDRVLCVAHSLVLKAMLRELFGDDLPEDARRPIQRNCCVHVVRYTGGRFVLKETGRIFYDAAAFEGAVAPLTVAHRGAGDLDMPEASLPAYSNAVASVCDIVKLDLRETKDGVPVMSHDGTLKRTMGWNARISSLTYREIFEKGRFLPVGGFEGLRIVRLPEALEIVKSVPQFWLDFKDFSPEFAERVLGMVREAGIDRSRLMVATFTEPALEYFRDRHPEIRRVGHISSKVGADRETVLAYRDRMGLFGVNLPKKSLTAADIDFYRKNGLWTSVWFVQNGLDAKRFGTADALVTDHVSQVRTER